MASVSSRSWARSRVSVDLADVAEALVVERAQAHRQDEPAAGQDVERRGLAGELPGPPPAGREHHRPEPDPLGPHRHRREQHPRVVHLAVADGDRVVREHGVPARSLGRGGEVGLGERIAAGDDDAVLHRPIFADETGAGPDGPDGTGGSGPCGSAFIGRSCDASSMLARVPVPFLFVLLATALVACGSPSAASPTAGPGGSIAVRDAWVRAAAEGGLTAAYLTITNGTADRRRAGGRQRAAPRRRPSASTRRRPVDDGMTGMHHTPSIAIPANGTVALEPGGYHVMLEGLKRDLVAGETIQLALVFEQAGSVTVDAQVRAG